MRVQLKDGVLFRPMTEADVPVVAEIEKICFRSPWSKRMLKEELRNSLAKYYVMELDNALIAYAGMWVYFDEAHVTNVAVLPEYRRRGYGRQLMLLSMQAALEADATQMTLEVRQSNLAAQAMYFQLGFTLSGKRKGYYEDTKEDALILWNKDMNATIQQLRG